MSSGKSTSPISQAEIGRVLLYVISQGGHLIKPVHNIAKFLNEHFGWSLGSGAIRAKAIIDLLLKAKVIEVIRDGKGLKSINLVSAQKLDDNLSPRLIKPKVAPLFVAEVPVIVPRRKFKLAKKGEAKRNRSKMLIGDRAERRLYDLCIRISWALRNKFPDIISDMSVFRSGHHNPKKGKIDLQDSAGEDITILVTLVDEGRYRKERIIYDAKNSKHSATRFNGNIRLYPGQTGAVLKKAVSANQMRSDREIVDEIVGDMISVNLLSAECKKDVLSEFSDIA